jgi:hypothetical protein
MTPSLSRRYEKQTSHIAAAEQVWVQQANIKTVT